MITLDDIQGHWSRDWIKAPGVEDHATRVHWMQCGALYADVRIPLERPDLNEARTLIGQSPDVLVHLLKAEGFAGDVGLAGTQCTWHRKINWHGNTEEIDVGDISFDEQGRMVEKGVHADYTELWSHDAPPAQSAYMFEGEGWLGYLICVGAKFVLGVGRPNTPTTKPIVDELASGIISDGAATLFNGLHAVGSWDGASAIATLATNPLCEGSCVLTLDHNQFVWRQTRFDGSRHDVRMKAVAP